MGPGRGAEKMGKKVWLTKKQADASDGRSIFPSLSERKSRQGGADAGHGAARS